jgi:hypothetical protein
MTNTDRLTDAQRDALRYLDGLTRGEFLPTPRTNVLRRLVARGLATGEVRCYTTYRKRTRSEFVCTGITEAGRAAL